MTVFLVALGAYLLLEIYNVLWAGGFILGVVFRHARAMLRGHRIVSVPKELVSPLACGLISSGSQLVVAGGHEWDGLSVSRFALPSTISGFPNGTSLEVINTGRDWLEVRAIDQLGAERSETSHPNQS